MRTAWSLRLLSLLLALSLLLTGSVFAAPARVDFDKLTIIDLSPDELRRTAAQACSLSKDVSNAAAVQAAVNELYDYLTVAATNYTLAMIAYNRDTSSPSVEQTYLQTSSTYTEVLNILTDCLRTLLKSPCAQAVRDIVDEADVEAALSGAADLQTQLSQITDRYTTLYNQTLSAGHSSYDALIRDVGGLYLKMIAELKKAAGSGEKAVQSFYDVNGRSGGYAAYEPVRRAAREQIAPAFLRLLLLTEDVTSGPDSGEAALGAVAGVADRHFPELTDAIDFMVSYGYYDVTAAPEKADAGFTTYLYSYEAPYLFLPNSGGLDGVAGVSHELGHYYNYFTYGPDADTDSAEVHSQGLELLYTLYYDEIFGENAGTAREAEVTDVLSSVVLGCIMDEFQYRAFTQTPSSPEALAAMYTDILGEYGLAALSGGSLGTYWLWVNHSFSQPMYYLSYALSALPALEIWATAQDDAALAHARYDDFMVLSNENGFERGLRGAGLSKPGNAEAAARIASDAKALAASSGGWLYSDVAACWGATEIQWFGLQGAINGYADGTFRPGKTLTRAHVASVLANLVGSAAGSLAGASAPRDVPKGYWAGSAIKLVVSAGLMELDEQGNFNPDQPITRQEFARVVYALLEANDVTAAGNTAYTDQALISENCREAVNALGELGIMHGRADGSFNANGILTRQEMAVVFYRTFVCLALA